MDLLKLTPLFVVQKQDLTEYVMRKVNRLLYYKLNQYWDQDELDNLFSRVRSNFTAFESGTRVEIEQEIEEDDELLERVLDEEEEEDSRRSESNSRHVNHDACAVCQQEEAPSRNALLACSSCFRRFHRLCHTPPATAFTGNSLEWLCSECSLAGAVLSDDEN